jgi:hypothetical protein
VKKIFLSVMLGSVAYAFSGEFKYEFLNQSSMDLSLQVSGNDKKTIRLNRDSSAIVRDQNPIVVVKVLNNPNGVSSANLDSRLSLIFLGTHWESLSVKYQR